MNWRQHIMALVLAAILLAVVLATAARPQTPTIWIKPPPPDALLINQSNVTSRAKIPLQRGPTFPPNEASSTRGRKAVWDAYGPADTKQASIYVLYTP
jgi:hypothetical protein